MSKKKYRRQNKRQLPLITIGVGTLMIGLAVLMMATPKPGSNAQSSSSVLPLPVNYAAPELSLENINGKTESLADYRGRVVLVNNWATWCPPCKAEMPTLAAYFNGHNADGFTIIAVEAGEPIDVVSQFVQSYDLKFSVWLDPGGASLKAFGNGNLPNSYVIDRSGTVRYAWTGGINKAMLEKYVTPLLAEDS